MPAPTRRFVNIYSLTITPTYPASTAFLVKGVKSAAFDDGISQIRESGDGDHYITTSVNDFEDPSFTVAGINPLDLANITSSTILTVQIVVGDALNGITAGGGGRVYTLTNAQMAQNSQSHQHRQFAQLGTKFNAISTDGLTSPVSIAAL